MQINLERIEFKNNQEPAINATTLNQMQQNTQNAIKELEENIEKKETLYIDVNGTISNFTLSKSVENYDEIEVEYYFLNNENQKVYVIERILSRKQKFVMGNLSNSWWSGVTSLWLMSQGIIFNTTSVSFGHKNTLQVATTGITSVGAGKIYITKIKGIIYGNS